MAGVEEVKRAKELSKYSILSKPNVLGVGYGYKERGGQRTDELCVVALVRVKLPKSSLKEDELVPPTFDGVSTDVVQVGEITALQSRADRWRPAPGGVSIGHFQITAGTLGTAVRDAASGQRLILSNNHVLANSNDAQIGDTITQPGPIDGGHAISDKIAELERFIPIEFTREPSDCGIANWVAKAANFVARLMGSLSKLEPVREDPAAVNQVDAAVARPVDNGDLLTEILDIGEVSGKAEAVLGMGVRKSGRTTAFTTGTITVLEATIDVNYGEGRKARFEGQIVSTPMSQGGDSGSLIVAGDSLQAVGLLYAGSNQATIFNSIGDVAAALSIVI
ncbi:MAG: hypothetical protein ACE5JF_05590 [Anaerolineales bacterium]